jgi:hypothetical protein
VERGFMMDRGRVSMGKRKKCRLMILDFGLEEDEPQLRQERSGESERSSLSV